MGLLVVCGLAACGAGPVVPSRPGVIPAGLLLAAELRPQPPRAAGPDECWGNETSPAVIETVTEQDEVSVAITGPDGVVTRPAVFQTRTRQRIVAERREVWFRMPCPALVDPDFIGTLQRALKVRGFYRGAVSGAMDAATRRAVRNYQAPQGLDSGTLSLLAARQLGLIAVDRAELG